jgi:hypothetical protein
MTVPILVVVRIAIAIILRQAMLVIRMTMVVRMVVVQIGTSPPDPVIVSDTVEISVAMYLGG